MILAACAACAGEADPNADAAAIYREELRRGVELLRSGDVERARGALQSAHFHNPMSAEAPYWLALLHMERPSFSLARDKARDTVSHAGDAAPEAFLLRGQLLLQARDFQAATVDLMRAKALLETRMAANQHRPDRAYVLTLFNLGRLHYHQTAGPNAHPEARADDLRRAAEYLRAAAPHLESMAARSPELGPTWVEALLYQGWTAYGERKWAEADAFYIAAEAAAERVGAVAGGDMEAKGIDAVFGRGLCARRRQLNADAMRFYLNAYGRMDAWNRARPREIHHAWPDLLLQLASMYFQPDLRDTERGLLLLREFERIAPMHPEHAGVRQFLRQWDAEHPHD